MNCFVIMPFSGSFNDYYQKILKPTIENCGLKSIRADEIYGVKPIIEDIAECIINAEIVIADVTDKNPNVNYELGMAHALSKQVIIISQKIDDIPFDYRHIRAIIYDTKRVDWADNLKSELAKTINLIISDFSNIYSIEAIRKYHKNNSIDNIWGLQETYETRQKMNVRLNEIWDKLTNNLDIIGFGFKSFRDSQNYSIKEKVKNGLKLRILTINPLSPFVKQREIDELQLIGSIKKTIFDLERWVNDLKKVCPNENNVQLKFYNSLPLDFYWRQEDKLFVGPYLYGIGSQQTITFEYKEKTRGYTFYRNYFESLWENDDFCKEDYNLFKMKKKNTP
jgi:hypothetical protein